jgi:hypothetical protein
VTTAGLGEVPPRSVRGEVGIVAQVPVRDGRTATLSRVANLGQRASASVASTSWCSWSAGRSRGLIHSDAPREPPSSNRHRTVEPSENVKRNRMAL